MATHYEIVKIEMPKSRTKPIGNFCFEWVSPLIPVAEVQKSGAKIYFHPSNNDFATFPSDQSGALAKEPRFLSNEKH